ncbi:MAG: hypothetical protein GYB68_03280, partial [Chloroflexi bacterium]|nr:hypothetical protein [Chloroflexota bacterium]
ASAIFTGIEGFSVRDELYRHDYQPDCEVHFVVDLGEDIEPVVWTRSHSRGRVCYCSLGHTVSAMRHPTTQAILQRGLAWVAAG